MAEGAPLVLDLLTYIEQVEKLKSKPAFTVPTDYFFAFQHRFKGLPEVRFNLQAEGDDVWLRLPRLKEIPAPEPDDTLKAWVSLPRSPDKTPELKSESVIYEGDREVARERLVDHPEVKERFDWYVENQWQPWAGAEGPRRELIAVYNKLFALQQAIASEGAETPLELVWGIGVAAWKKAGFATAVCHPLLVQSCEVTLNENTLDLDVRPRDVEPKLEADCYVEMGLPGVRQLDAFWKGTLQSAAHRLNPFEASSFEDVLRAAVAHLDPTGAYEARADDVTPPKPGGTLRITNTWVLFGRRRSGDIFLEDVRRLKKSVEAATSLPDVVRSLVEPGDDTVRARPERPFRGLSSSDGPKEALELFFPMPYNDEQVSIVQKLEDNCGVVVQGPPGTGKTHTIANVICHYLAQGKRVLVTAKSESALAVLQEKLPEDVQPLSVALLSNERDGMKQFEHSIQTIASRVAAMNPFSAEAGIATAEERLKRLHASIVHVDRTVADFAAKHMRHYSFQGRESTPEEMAKAVVEHAGEHEWFDDEPPVTQDGSLPFTHSDIDALREARRKVGDDLAYFGCSLPRVDAFPPWSEIIALHHNIVQARDVDAKIRRGTVLPLVESHPETLEQAHSLLRFLDERIALKATLAGLSQPWLESLARRVAGMQPNEHLLVALANLCREIEALEPEWQELIAMAVAAPDDAEVNEDVRNAVARLVTGKSAFAMPFGKREARKLLAAVTVLGVAPTTAEEWAPVQRLLAWRAAARRVLALWVALSRELGLQTPSSGVEAAFREIAAWRRHVENVRRLVFEFDAPLRNRLEEVFGRKVTDRLRSEGESFVSVALASLQAHVDKARLARASRRIAELKSQLEGCSGGIVNELSEFLSDSIGRASADESVLEARWLRLQAELSRLTSLQPAFREILRVSGAIKSAGATKWAQRVRTLPATSQSDPQVPATWLEAWNWRQAVIFLERIDGHHRLRELFEERRTLTSALARTYQELVAAKTWLGVFNNSPDSIRQALQAYLNAVQAMGAGTGVRAVRHRKTARDAMLRAYRAVPCWVLPQWRVSETIPPEVGLFDLVIIDEASQSDIWALPALLRGKKLLVVGDHKQVSPSAVGMAEERIKELSNRFLKNQPHGSEMTPDKSVYDLARVVFAGNSVMLKEHFRCVPAIIEFSNREFYMGDIKPLRVPKANERLDPPLVDVYVKGGARKGDVNPAEAKAIVDEIEAILADEQFTGRSIGVVTLLGTAQAAYIHELVSSRISAVDIVNRKIAVGPPPVFQGRERDIMLVSMVLGPGDRAAANKNDMFQRFNVALSRARDRMYLFRSVSETDFREDTLNGKVIRHFRQPFSQDLLQVHALRERCESGFEREMFDELVKRGYRVEPQVRCGGFRIDFVVQGSEGRRLAIECDGDRFHGPGQWTDDMARQRVLERAGWTFWRCFASSFVRRREEVLADLFRTLGGLGIEPLGAEAVDNSVWVYSKEVDPLGVDEMSEAA